MLKPCCVCPGNGARVTSHEGVKALTEFIHTTVYGANFSCGLRYTDKHRYTAARLGLVYHEDEPSEVWKR